MPSQHISTFLTVEELKTLEETCKKTGVTRYRLFKDAIREYCESRMKEGTEHDRGKTEREPERKSEGGRDAEERGRGVEASNQGGTQQGPTTEHGSDLEEYLRYLRVAA